MFRIFFMEVYKTTIKFINTEGSYEFRKGVKRKSNYEFECSTEFEFLHRIFYLSQKMFKGVDFVLF